VSSWEAVRAALQVTTSATANGLASEVPQQPPPTFTTRAPAIEKAELVVLSTPFT